MLEDFFGFLPVLFPRLFDSAVFSFKNRCLQLVCNLAFFFHPPEKSREKSVVVERYVPGRQWWNFYMWQ